MFLLSLNRYSAAAWHLLGSMVVASLCVLLVFAVWYPGLFAYASGVGEIVLLLVAVDIVLGPLLTLIIFNPQKKELGRDLCIVVLLQLSALSYGAYSVFIARPAFAVFNAGRFDLVYANEISQDNFARAADSAYASAPLWGPQFVAASLPEDAAKAKAIVLEAVAGGDDVQNYPEYFQPLASKREDLRAASLSFEALKARNPDTPEVARLAERYADNNADVAYVPVFAKSSNVVVVVDLHSGTVMEMVPLKPY